MKSVYFLIPLFIIGFSVSAYAVSDHANYRAINNNPEYASLDVLDIQPIPKGSQIDSAEITLFMNPKTSPTCKIYLEDDNLSRVDISKEFNCQGTNIIQLNKNGIHALQSLLYQDSYKIAVGFPSDLKRTLFSVTEININYHSPQTFAKIENGIVTNVIVSNQDFINSVGGQWEETDPDYKGKFAGIGDTWDSQKQKFIPPRPFDSWSLDENDKWIPPVLQTDELTIWNETSKTWELDNAK